MTGLKVKVRVETRLLPFLREVYGNDNCHVEINDLTRMIYAVGYPNTISIQQVEYTLIAVKRLVSKLVSFPQFLPPDLQFVKMTDYGGKPTPLRIIFVTLRYKIIYHRISFHEVLRELLHNDYDDKEDDEKMIHAIAAILRLKGIAHLVPLVIQQNSRRRLLVERQQEVELGNLAN